MLEQAIQDQQRPVAIMVTVWLCQNKTISDLTDFIVRQFKNNPILAGVIEGRQKTRSRGSPLYTFVREYKSPDAVDSYSGNGEHYHICLSYSSAYSTPAFIKFAFDAAIEAGIIAPRVENLPFPYFITGNHKLYEPKGKIDAFQHFKYMAKPQTKKQNGLPTYGGSRLRKNKTNATFH
jgi:hypothetical protein